jgi:hypothetical protein
VSGEGDDPMDRLEAGANVLINDYDAFKAANE